jgi:leucyl-tRNA synthetase
VTLNASVELIYRASIGAGNAAQVNGKVRGEFTVPRDADEAVLRPIVLADEGVQRHIAGQEIKKFIVIKNKLVSIVV